MPAFHKEKVSFNKPSSGIEFHPIHMPNCRLWHVEGLVEIPIKHTYKQTNKQTNKLVDHFGKLFTLQKDFIHTNIVNTQS